MTERRKRFIRTAHPEGLVLTDRDAAVVWACWEHRWLTREQLQRLLPLPGVGRTNDRLRRLYDHGYLDRIRAGTVGAGLQPVYLAGEAAVPLIAARTEGTEAEIRERLREDRRASAVLLPHDLQVNDLRIALTGAIDESPALDLDLWLHAQECHDPYAPGRSLRPDGYFRFWHEDLLHAFFLEVDRGTTPLPRWKQKVERYLDYREGGHYTARYGLQRFRVLVTALTPLRLAHLREATQALTGRSFWFTLTAAVIRDPSPERPLWQPVGQDTPRALVAPTGSINPRGEG